MRKKPPKSRDKPFFCHDENLEFFSLRKRCNSVARFISVVKLMKRQGAKDQEVLSSCHKEDFHILTHNTSDFRSPSNNISIGIICIGLRAEHDWVPKFLKVLRKLPRHKDYYNKTVFIANIISIKNRLTGDTRLLG